MLEEEFVSCLGQEQGANHAVMAKCVKCTAPSHNPGWGFFAFVLESRDRICRGWPERADCGCENGRQAGLTSV